MTAADTNRIHDRIDVLTSAFTEMTVAVRSFEVLCGPCRDDVKRHDEMLRGNGQSGLRDEVKRLSDALDSRKWWKRGAIRFVGEVALITLSVVLAMKCGV